MSQENLSRAKQRLEQAKREVAWMLAILRDQNSALEDYDLSADERQEIVQETRQEMTELLLLSAQELAKQERTPIPVETKALDWLELQPVQQYDFKKIVRPGEVIRVEIVTSGGGSRKQPPDD